MLLVEVYPVWLGPATRPRDSGRIFRTPDFLNIPDDLAHLNIRRETHRVGDPGSRAFLCHQNRRISGRNAGNIQRYEPKHENALLPACGGDAGDWTAVRVGRGATRQGAAGHEPD